MDVTCERCGTEYEFDETLVAARGTTVKCTNCGHLFKVFRPGATATGSGEPRSWTVQRASTGATESIASLKELQRLITVGQLTPDDQISRSGEAWKRLGDIAELQTFFAAAAAARESQRPARRDPTAGRIPDERARPTDRPPPQSAPLPRAGKATMMGVGALPASLSQPAHGTEDVRGRTIEVAVPPPANAHPSSAGSTTSPGGARAPSDRPVPRAAPPSSRPPLPPTGMAPTGMAPGRTAPGLAGRPVSGPPPSSAPLPPPPRTPSEMTSDRPPRVRTRVQESVPPPPPNRASERPSERPSVRPLHVDDDDDVPLRPAPRSRSGLWVGLVVLLAIGAGVAMGWERILGLIEGAAEGDPAEPFVVAGDEALRADHDDAYDDAIGQYTRALAHREHDARALTGLSRAHALIAQSRIFAASDLEARAGDDPALRGEAAGLRRESAEHAERAREHAEEAARHGPGATPAAQADTEVALSDALRLAGDRQLARSRLDRARTLFAEPTAESLRVEALLVADEAQDPSAGRAIAERAVEADPGLLRARILLARAHLASGDVAAARAQVQAVLDRAPEHPRAVALRDAIDEGLPPAAPVVAAPDAGTPTTAAPTTAAPTTAAPTTAAPTTVAPATAPPTTTAGSGATAPAETGRTAPSAGSTPVATGEYDDLVRSGQQRLENGDARGARRFFEGALRGRPGGTEATVGMGYVLLAEGNARGALAQFESAAGRGYVEAHIGVADAQRRLGDRRAALAAYERYLQVAPSGRSSSIAQRQAQRLRDELSVAESGGTTTTERHEGGSSTTTTSPTEATPETPREELPAPREAAPEPPAAAPAEDAPAIDSEP